MNTVKTFLYNPWCLYQLASTTYIAIDRKLTLNEISISKTNMELIIFNMELTFISAGMGLK